MCKFVIVILCKVTQHVRQHLSLTYAILSNNGYYPLVFLCIKIKMYIPVCYTFRIIRWGKVIAKRKDISSILIFNKQKGIIYYLLSRDFSKQ